MSRRSPDGARIFAAGFAVFFTETALFHLLLFTHDYAQATLVVAYAVLGIGIGALAAHRAPERGSAMVPALQLALPCTILVAFANVVRLPEHVFLSPLLILPFAVGGALLGLFLRRHPAGHVYFFDLLGATAGLAFALQVIPWLKTENALLAAASLLALPPLFARGRSRAAQATRVAGGLVFVLTAALLAVNLRTGWLAPERITVCYDVRFPRKTFCHSADRGSASVPLLSRDNMVARISVRSSAAGAPGRSNPIDFDGHNNDLVTDRPASEWLFDVRLPLLYFDAEGRRHTYAADPRVLVIGTSAQGIVKPLRQLVTHPSRILGLELNPGIVDLMTGPLFEASARAYEGLRIETIDARTFLASSTDRFDLITLLNAHRAGTIGHIGEPDFLRTREASRAFLEHLTPGGLVLLEERDVGERAKLATLRTLGNFKVALAELGAAEPARHFFVYRWNADQRGVAANSYVMIVVKRSALDDADRAFFEGFLADRFHKERVSKRSAHDTSLEYLPGRDVPSAYQAFLTADDPSRLYPSTVDLSPTSDDRPYVAAVYRHEPSIASALAWVGGLCAALVAAALALLLRRIDPPERLAAWGLAGYAGSIGVGYLVIELGLMGFHQRLLGSPTYAMVFVLGALMLSSSAGSYVSRRWPSSRIGWAFGAVVLLAAYQLWGNPALVERLGAGPLATGVALAVTIAPLGFFMGMPFPLGMELAKRHLGPRSTAALFAINGACSTFAVVLGWYLGVRVGFAATFALGVLCYAVAGTLGHALARRAHPRPCRPHETTSGPTERRREVLGRRDHIV